MKVIRFTMNPPEVVISIWQRQPLPPRLTTIHPPERLAEPGPAQLEVRLPPQQHAALGRLLVAQHPQRLRPLQLHDEVLQEARMEKLEIYFVFRIYRPAAN